MVCLSQQMKSPQIDSFGFSPAPALAFAVPLTFFIPFAVWGRSSSHRGHVLQVCVWAPPSLHNLETHRSCWSQLFYHHQNGFWIRTQRWQTSGVVLYILASLSWISVFGAIAFPRWRTSMTMCFLWSRRLAMNFLVPIVTVSIMMAMVAELQSRLWWCTLVGWICWRRRSLEDHELKPSWAIHFWQGCKGPLA